MNKTSLLINSAIAGLFAANASAADTTKTTATTTTTTKVEMVKCVGLHSCSGNSACKGNGSAGKGQNSCGSHGFVMATAEECAKGKNGKPGKVITE